MNKSNAHQDPVATPRPAMPGRRILQRKCACGGSAALTGECEECRKKHLEGPRPELTLQRRALADDGSRESESVPPIVHEVLRSPGQPLDPATRAFFEPRFGHDFSRVRIHTDARAAESARAVNALAYTVGPNITFAPQQYAPETTAGRKLLAHELTHALQQGAGSRPVRADLRIADTAELRDAESERLAQVAEQGEFGTPALSEPPKVARKPVPPGPPAAASPAPCAPAPVATLDEFRAGGTTSGENCCNLCPQDLGAGIRGTASNGMEMRIDIASPCADAEYDITRVRESWLWHRLAGSWTELEHQGPGVNDDHHDDDECLRLRRGRFLYVIDNPGYPSVALPAAAGQTFPGYTGVRTDPAATEVVAQDTFAEWVIFRQRAHGIPWTPISSPKFFYWHSVVWLEQVAGHWQLKAGSSRIAKGFRGPVVRP